MNTANLQPFDDLLQKTLRCSRYARHALEADSSLLDWLRENYAAPCDRAEMLALLRQANPSGETTSHSTKPAQSAGQVAGYPQPSPVSGRGSERKKQLLIPAEEGAIESLMRQTCLILNPAWRAPCAGCASRQWSS